MSKPGRYYSGGQQQYSLVGNSAAFYGGNNHDNGLNHYDAPARNPFRDSASSLSRPTVADQNRYSSYESYRSPQGPRPNMSEHNRTRSYDSYYTPPPAIGGHARHSSYDAPYATPLTFDNLNALKGPGPSKPRKSGWSTRRKAIVWGGVAAVIVIIFIAVGVGVAVSKKSVPFTFELSNAKVTSSAAFDSGGATKVDVSNVNDGIGAGADEYTYYSGTADQFPTKDKWISFADMWTNNLPNIKQSCQNLKAGKDNTDTVNQEIYDAIQNRSAASFVDHRFVLAVILQESHGCPRVSSTTSSGGVKNPGLMQSHDGHSYVPQHSNESIVAMVQDGTQGTSKGDGLVQNLNLYGNLFSAARGYNSGYIPKSGNLSEAAGATACYCSDIANRLTGWVYATSKCSG